MVMPSLRFTLLPDGSAFPSFHPPDRWFSLLTVLPLIILLSLCSLLQPLYGGHQLHPVPDVGLQVDT